MQNSKCQITYSWWNRPVVAKFTRYIGEEGKVSEDNGIGIFFLNQPKVTQQVLDNQLRFLKEASSVPQQNQDKILSMCTTTSTSAPEQFLRPH